MEISIDPALLNNYSNEQSMGHFINSITSSSEFYKLKMDLVKEVLKIINKNLTKKQKEIIKMTYIDGKTQNEISVALGKHQTAVHKTLQGNIDYTNEKKRYGGALKKIRKLCAKNKKIQDILNKLKEKNEQRENI